MINLIPPIVRKAIITEYWVRVASVWLFVFGLVGAAVFLFALPVYVLLNSQVDVYATSAAEAAKRVAEYDLSAGALVRANVMAQKIFELRDVERFSEIVQLLESLQGTDIVLDSFEFSHTANALAPVIVTGEAATRQSLADFRDALLSQKNISEVVLPISNLAKDKEIKFSISITFKKAE
jgi:dipeptide/tripeptide permease